MLNTRLVAAASLASDWRLGSYRIGACKLGAGRDYSLVVSEL
jgi:hypothetical protein